MICGIIKVEVSVISRAEHLFVLQSKYKNLPTSATCFVFMLFVLFSVAITALSAHIALGSGRISLSFLYIRQFVAMDTPFVRFFA